MSSGHAYTKPGNKKPARGGKRPGAGRKPTGRTKRVYYVTDAEDAKLRQYLEQLRKHSD